MNTYISSQLKAVKQIKQQNKKSCRKSKPNIFTGTMANESLAGTKSMLANFIQFEKFFLFGKKYKLYEL